MTNTTKSQDAQIRDLLKKVEELQKQQRKDDLWKADSSPFAPPATRSRESTAKAQDGQDETEKAQWAGSDSPFAVGGN
ncbi:hypothetical protein V5735_01565 (plasmid) [Haladaptatus sp. SPP-AMP-3]|uniref:hypothetical protein n=1 Tax=Haladaptatus sp. SPP-AMP-3 TaxID=3121295 RepID=UPI003C2E321C